MKIKVKVHSGSSQEKIEEVGPNNFEVWLHDRPIEGKANEELIKILKKHFRKPVTIKSGLITRTKIFEVEDENSVVKKKVIKRFGK